MDMDGQNQQGDGESIRGSLLLQNVPPKKRSTHPTKLILGQVIPSCSSPRRYDPDFSICSIARSVRSENQGDHSLSMSDTSICLVKHRD
ncbi:hypothetical protein L226DRAFT_540000 [Lentinus tigrinus ALCF2SS1-7]|uniref:uncharacterized protein n=1 Tax=Lentinus tigrinus ALCF2SS1-7 TaxID=1328758 RepID=UPI001165F7BD|nr:hypothetical protein L226DRAFT_540000 [Lentinus tigrinus ALCF2SS1-7]